MAVGGTETVVTRKAEGGAIGADLAVIVGTDTNLQVKLPAAAGNRAVGLTALAADAADKAIPIIVAGPAVGIASAAIAVGDLLEVAGANGRLKKAVPTAGVNALVVGMALTSAAADGDKFDVMVAPSTMQGA